MTAHDDENELPVMDPKCPDRITKIEFAALAALAWMFPAKKLLALKIAEDTGHSVREVEYWFSENSPKKPPRAVVERAFTLAGSNWSILGDLLDSLIVDPIALNHEWFAQEEAKEEARRVKSANAKAERVKSARKI